MRWGLFQNLLRSVPGRQREREGRPGRSMAVGAVPTALHVAQNQDLRLVAAGGVPSACSRPRPGTEAPPRGPEGRFLGEGMDQGLRWLVLCAWLLAPRCGEWPTGGAHTCPAHLCPKPEHWGGPGSLQRNDGRRQTSSTPTAAADPHPTPAFLIGGPGVGWGAHFLACSPLVSSPEGSSFVPCVHVWGLYPSPDVYLGDWWCCWQWAPAVPHHTGNWVGLSRGRRGGRRAPRVLTSRQVSVPISQGRPGPAVPNLPVWPARTPPTWLHLGAGRMGWQGSGPPRPQCELHLCGAS